MTELESTTTAYDNARRGYWDSTVSTKERDEIFDAAQRTIRREEPETSYLAALTAMDTTSAAVTTTHSVEKEMAERLKLAKLARVLADVRFNAALNALDELVAAERISRLPSTALEQTNTNEHKEATT